MAQKAVSGILPSLPEVVGIVDQGGDGYGAAQAFTAAGQPTPDDHHGQPPGRARLVEGAEGRKDGYTTWSASIAPGVSTLAFWVAQQILDGHKDIPHDLLVPYLAFTQDDFEAALPTIPVGRRGQQGIQPGRGAEGHRVQYEVAAVQRQEGRNT